MTRSCSAILLLGCAFGLLAACDGHGPAATPTVGPLEHLRITATTATLTALTATTTLTATGTDADGQFVRVDSVSWAAADASVVAVVPTNPAARQATIRAVGNGTTTITARSKGLHTSLEIAVQQQVRDLLPEAAAVVELPGDVVLLTATPTDSLGHRVATAITWSSSDPSVATVDTGGRVTAQGFGTATIQATAQDFTEEVGVEVIGDRFFLNGDVRLRYDLDLPSTGSGPFPAVVWVHGSGRLDRNAQRLATDPLVPEGMAVLRYDKRGVGASTGTYAPVGPSNSNQLLRLLASDAAAGARFLARLPEIDASRIGIAANSQGGWIAPLAAAETDTLSYLMIWSGPTVSVGLEIFYSNLAANNATPLDEVYAQLDRFTGLAGYTPLPQLEQMAIPSIWLFGEIDRSIPVRLDTLHMHHLQAMGLPYAYHLYPSAGHDLRDTRTGTFVDLWSDWLAWLRREGIL